MQNLMSIDFEDYFCDLPFEEWGKYENRIVDTTPTLLELFEKFNVKATFFVVGYIAEKFPKIINDIQEKGHEIGSHSYSHIDLRKVPKIEAEKDLNKSFEVIEKITGERPLGFRAPFFSIDHSNSWILEFLRKKVKYDSSIFPVKSPLYGVPEAPRTIYHPSKKNFIENTDNEELIEIPPLTYRIFSFYNLPTAGGFYFRALPYYLVSKGIKNFNKKNIPAMLYFHPKDLDEGMPKIKEYSWHYYYGKRNIMKKFQKLLKEFKFTSVREFLGLNT